MNNKLLSKIIGKISTVEDKFKEFNTDEKIISRLLDLLSSELRGARVFEDKLSGQFLYNFGNPIDVGQDVYHCFGGVENLNIEFLYQACLLADKFLAPQQINVFKNKIKDKNNHENYIFELRPLLNLKEGVAVEHESKKWSNEDKNVDWCFTDNDLNILIEVKNRIKSEIKLLENISDTLKKYYGRQINEIEKFSPPDPHDLFKSVIEKFKIRDNQNFLQGCWINTGVLQDKNKLIKSFNDLDSQKIQFAIISSWDNKAYILVKDDSYKSKLLEIFGLKESNEFVHNY